MTNKELREKIDRLKAELAELGEKVEALPNSGENFKPTTGQKYWIVTALGDVREVQWCSMIGHRLYAIGNCHPTQQVAEDTVRVLKLIQKARESQDGFIPDWEDGEQRKYYLYLYKGKIDIGGCFLASQAPAFGYWGNQMACRLFVKENYDELLWFFKNYKG